MNETVFSFRTATEILFGRGSARDSARRIRAFGSRILLVHGANAARAAWLVADLNRQDTDLLCLHVEGEPALPALEPWLEAARVHRPDVVVSLGGGAVLDAGKAIAGLLRSGRPVIDHLEVVGSGLPLEETPLPFIAIPTTAGTGAEVTRNAVIGVPEHHRKVSLRDPAMLARLAIVDPALTDHAPKALTRDCGLDALTQLIEPYISNAANRISDALVRGALPDGINAFVTLMQGEDQAARDDLAFASLCGGLALANAGLGVVHGLAGPLGGLMDAPHGAICGALLVPGLLANRAAVEDAGIRQRIDEVFGLIGKALGVSAEQAPEAFTEFLHAHGLRSLTALGFTPEHFHEAAVMAESASSMKTNPVALSRKVLLSILEQAA
ncbi:iron-containing alcohol dehydrogenase [Allorhizobium sp. BGMRC 0089]|uniref:iron-containing alcohol dehydrogenase n=1 Tax=Allorhizobium sonneratiae TaxID=2934936 RepID=UPI002034905F|nr:iron-containing alcohol dehydrogenase [Allorhizobium sonneratiae]MCM2293266.1 iron-containing alcohol dehydrogenase [Allorhizobium sonneratiae]